MNSVNLVHFINRNIEYVMKFDYLQVLVRFTKFENLTLRDIIYLDKY